MAAQFLSVSFVRFNRPTSFCLFPVSQSQHYSSFRTQWLGNVAIEISSHRATLGPYSSKNPSVRATISFSLPTAKPSRSDSSEKLPKWSSKAIKSFAMGELEARKIKSTNTGTEALIMGILIEGTNFASICLRANGITLLKVRDEIAKMQGKPDMYYFSPEHPPLDEQAQNAIDWAIDEKQKSGDSGEITAVHLLLAVWKQPESTGHKLLSTLGFSESKAEELHSLISKPGFSD